MATSSNIAKSSTIKVSKASPITRLTMFSYGTIGRSSPERTVEPDAISLM